MKTKKEREKYREILKTLPEEIKNIAAAEKTRDLIDEVCEKFKISKKSENITDYVGDVYFGLLSPDDFQETIKKELKLEKETAKRVTMEIYRFIFHPVKKSLEEMYKIDLSPLAKMKVIPPPQDRPSTPPMGKDVYRELVEEEKEKNI